LLESSCTLQGKRIQRRAVTASQFQLQIKNKAQRLLYLGTQVLVRCRLRNEREVILDQCKIAQITQTATRVNFKANQEISKVLVTIWIHQNHEDSWEIWYEHSPFVPRAINVSLGAACFGCKF
jgi:hypothetical protein